MSYRQSSQKSRPATVSKGFGGGGFGGGSYRDCNVRGGGYGGAGLGDGTGGGFGGGYGGGAGFGGGVAGGYGGGAGFGGGVGGGYGGGAGFGGGVGGGNGGGAGFGGGAGGGFGDGDGIFSTDKKLTMKNLNDRLANYLNKVRDLEEANAELESKIKDFYDKQRAVSASGQAGKDYSKYYTEIESLKAEILTTSVDNASIVLQIDNATLAADDFRQKYEDELAVRQSVEADTSGLRTVLDDITASKSDLEAQLESLTDELAYLKENHEEETKNSQESGTGQVSVEIEAAPGIDLSKILSGVRDQYEALAEKNRKDAEDRFKKASAELKKEISSESEQSQSIKSEVSELKRALQALEIELQAQRAMKQSLEDTLAETEGKYCETLAQIQTNISAVEEQLEKVRGDIECKNAENSELLDTKSRLEQEIGTSHQLLDALGSTGDGSGSGQSGSGSERGTGSGSGQGAGLGSGGAGTGSGSSRGPDKRTVVKKVIEEIVDGTVVSTRIVEE
ncbi:keratin, type I cytoskeletal 12-like [Discoglossus pictus]